MPDKYIISLADAVKHGYSLSAITKEKFRFLNIAKFLKRDEPTIEILPFDALEDVGPLLSDENSDHALCYAAVSHVWDAMPARAGSPADQKLINNDIDEDPSISVSVLRVVCIAARQRGCKYLWMDKLCFRQDRGEDGKQDVDWHMKRMHSIYKRCGVCLVAAGGMVRLPRLVEKTTWIERAWTLQEALAPSPQRVMCLFEWSSGEREIGLGNQRLLPELVESVEGVITPSAGMAELSFLLAANLRADSPWVTKKNEKGEVIKDKKGKEEMEVKLPKDQDSQVWYFGNRGTDDRPIQALQGALERRNPTGEGSPSNHELSAVQLGIWRCITMRDARYDEDFVFATMGMFDVIVEPLAGRGKGYSKDDVYKLLNHYLIALSKEDLRADWFGVAPELGPARDATALPLMPAINYPKNEKRRTDFVAIKKLFKDQSAFNYYLSDTLTYTVDAPNGIKVTAPTHAVALANNLLQQDPPRLPLIERIHDGTTFEITDTDDEKCYAIVIGKKAQYLRGDLPMTATEAGEDKVLLMLLEYVSFTMERFRNIGYAWVREKLTDGWPEKTFGVGIRGG